MVLCICAAFAAAGCSSLSVSVAGDFQVLTSADAAVAVANPYRAGSVVEVDGRSQIYYWYLYCDDHGTAYVRWEGKDDRLGADFYPQTIWRLQAFQKEGPASHVFSAKWLGYWKEVADASGAAKERWELRDASADMFEGEKPLLVPGSMRCPQLVTFLDLFGKRAISTYRCDSDLWNDTELRVTKEKMFNVVASDLGAVTRDSFEFTKVVPFPRDPGHYLVLGEYTYMRWWDVPAMIAHQPSRRFAVEVKGDQAGPALNITPSLDYCDIGTGPEHWCDTNGRGWAVAAFKPVYVPGPYLTCMISLWDGARWRTISYNERNLVVPPEQRGRKTFGMSPMVVLLSDHILLFEGRYCFVIDIETDANGKPVGLVWTRAMDIGKDVAVWDAVNVGDGAMAVVRDENANSWCMYFTPGGFSPAQPLEMKAGRSAGSFSIESSGDGSCHLVWRDRSDGKLYYQSLRRDGVGGQ